MNISKHITLDEATKSNTAIRKGIANNPSNETIERMKLVAEKCFEPLREKLGPIRISSFYRSIELNKSIGGSKTSQHCLGEAIDMQAINTTNYHLFQEAIMLPEFDQIIWEFGTDEEPDWVHISLAKFNRKQILRAKKQGSKTIYIPYRK